MASNVARSDIDELQCIDFNWSNQLEMFKIAFEVEDLVVKYVDDENDEIGLNNQKDFEHAVQLASETNGFISLIFKNKSGRILSKKKFFVNKNDSKLKNDQANHIQQDSDTVKKDEWIVTYLDKFKKDVLIEMESKLKEVINDHLKTTEKSQNNIVLFETCESDCGKEFEENVSNILRVLSEIRFIDRPMKKAYLDEELKLTGAFQAEFLTDINMPDGTKCKPNYRFQKQWLIKNTGKLAWAKIDGSFPVQLVCMGGNIPTIKNEENISFTELNGSTQVCVNMKSPDHVGEFYSEWALVCGEFQFGPRLWCAIEVVEHIEDEKYLEHNNFSEDEEFVVVPDCLDLTKKWTPETTLNNLLTKNLSIDLENSYFEVSAQVAQTLNDFSANYDLIEKDNLLQFEAEQVNIEQQNAAEKADDTSIEKVIVNQTIYTDENINTDASTTTETVKTEVTQTKKEYILPEDNAPHHVSKFDIIRNSFANLKGPSNIGDTKLDLTNIKNSLPGNATSVLSSNLTIPNINSSVIQITNAIGSLGSLSSVYQTSVDLNEKNMNSLMSMGFANRTLNSRLLIKYNNDIEKVLQDLLDRQY